MGDPVHVERVTAALARVTQTAAPAEVLAVQD
jgi:hypothetical protein